MKTFKKAAMIFAGAITMFLVYVQFTYKREFEVPFTGIKSSTDSSVIARGEYIVTGPAHCYGCHVPDSLKKSGLREPLIGGYYFDTPFAKFYTPNITPDSLTGIGKRTDEDLARALRYNVSHNGNAMIGVMPFNDMTDDDIRAVISFLRTMKPVRHQVPEHEINMMGKILMRYVIKPVQIEQSLAKPDTTEAYGKYLAYTIANCRGCHTNRGSIGEFIGDDFGGGYSWKVGDEIYHSPNLTPNDSAGRIAHWSEEIFIQRFHAGRVLEHSPMPWEVYQKITDNDLKAIYRFLRTLPPSVNVVARTVEKVKDQD